MENKEQIIDDFIKYAMEYFKGQEISPSDIVRCTISLENAVVTGLIDAVDDINGMGMEVEINERNSEYENH